MDRKYLVSVGIAIGVAIGLGIVFIGNTNASESQFNVVPAEEGIIVSNIIHPGEKVSKTFDANKLGKMFIEFEIKSDKGARVDYWMESPSGETLLTTPKISSSTQLTVNDERYALIPMTGSPDYDEISGNLVFLNYGRIHDILNDLNGSIALVERGAPDDGQMTFRGKEMNVAAKGASALIVFNDRAGIFYGDLRSSFVDEPATIPAFSMSREDGLELVNKLKEETLSGTIIDADEQSEKFLLPYASFDIDVNEKGTYEIWFNNEGNGSAEITVKYVFRPR